MKNPRLARWSDPEADAGLLLFAQRVEESVFDYALDSYKVPALNTHTRCLELEQAVATVRREGLPKHTLIPVVQELAASIRGDSAAQQLLGSHAEHYGKYERWDVDRPQALGVQVQQLLSVLTGRYELALIDQLRASIPDGKEKRKIVSHSMSLVVEWLNRGFTRGHVYASVRDFFFRGSGPTIDGIDSFNAFLALFPEGVPKWSVLLRVSGGVRRLQQVLEGFCEVRESAPPPRTRRRVEADYLNAPHDGLYVRFDDLEANDPRKALERAISRIRMVGTFASLHAHSLDFSNDGSGLVYHNDGSVIRLSPAVPAVRKHRLGRGKGLDDRFSKSISAFRPHKLPNESFKRIVAALKMHATALSAPSNEEQLYSLWIAVEALLPFEDADSRIGRVVDTLVPLLSREYPTVLIEDLCLDLQGCIKPSYQSALKHFPDSMTEMERCAALVTAVDTQDARDELFAACEDNPLLRFRLFEVSQKLISADRIKQTIKDHEQRIAWHLRRIYRTRNSLVHTGQSVPYLESLVVSLHSYVIRVLQLTEYGFSQDPLPVDIDGALLRARFDHEHHMDALGQSGSTHTTIENSRLHVLGLP